VLEIVAGQLPLRLRRHLLPSHNGRNNDQTYTGFPLPAMPRPNVRFGSEADVCAAIGHVRFTANSDRKSRHAAMVMSALHLKADMCGATNDVGKSRQRREAIIPLYNELRSILTSIPKRSTTILTSSRNRPWRPNGFGTAFNRAKIAAG